MKLTDQEIQKRIKIVNECWEWQGGNSSSKTGRNSYAIIRVDGMKRYLHRVLYKRTVGEIPEGLTLDHLCRNTLCVNPKHLEPVTQAENSRRAFVSRNIQKSNVCKSGHKFEGDNLTYAHKKRKDGIKVRYRVCIECRRRYGRKANIRKRTGKK